MLIQTLTSVKNVFQDVLVDFHQQQFINTFSVPQLGMKLDEINKHSWFLEQFYNQILWLREFYFKQHNLNPGLFSAVVSKILSRICRE